MRFSNNGMGLVQNSIFWREVSTMRKGRGVSGSKRVSLSMPRLGLKSANGRQAEDLPKLASVPLPTI